MRLNNKVSFGASWSLIGSSALFCYFVSQLLLIVADTEQYAYTVTSGATKVLASEGKSMVASSTNNVKTNMYKIETNKGSIVVELDFERSPNTAENFKKLADSGFYNGVKFHRVIEGFMIQGGDPNSKNDGAVNTWGTGGPGYKFNDELRGDEKYTRGTLAMANSGPNTNGSQFFIMHRDNALPPNYTVFGKVVSGLEVVDAIAEVPTTGSPFDRPLSPVIVNSIGSN